MNEKNDVHNMLMRDVAKEKSHIVFRIFATVLKEEAAFHLGALR